MEEKERDGVGYPSSVHVQVSASADNKRRGQQEERCLQPGRSAAGLFFSYVHSLSVFLSHLFTGSCRLLALSD